MKAEYVYVGTDEVGIKLRRLVAMREFGSLVGVYMELCDDPSDEAKNEIRRALDASFEIIKEMSLTVGMERADAKHEHEMMLSHFDWLEGNMSESDGQ